MANVVIVGGSDETRLLLRGLVRLHHHRVVAEGRSPQTLRDLAADIDAPVVLLDVDVDQPEWAEQISRSLKGHQGLRAILLTANRTTRLETQAKEMGISSLLRRPFAVHELVEAIDASAVPPPTPTADARRPTA